MEEPSLGLDDIGTKAAGAELAAGLSGESELAISPSAGLGPVTHHHPDDLPSAHDFGICRVFGAIQGRGLQTSVTSFGGCVAFRPQRSGDKLPADSWGIAIDLNSENNPQGAGDMHAGLIEIFARPASSGEETGNARATPCIFSFASDIEFSRGRRFWLRHLTVVN